MFLPLDDVAPPGRLDYQHPTSSAPAVAAGNAMVSPVAKHAHNRVHGNVGNARIGERAVAPQHPPLAEAGRRLFGLSIA